MVDDFRQIAFYIVLIKHFQNDHG